MTFNKFLASDNGNTFLNDASAYPTFVKHLKFRFGYMHILYPSKHMLMYLEDFLINNSVKLKQIEVLANTNFSVDDLGTNIHNKTQNTSDAKGSDTLSYTGYNVTGDYNKSKTKQKASSESNSNTTTLNKLIETGQLVNFEIKRLFDEMDNQLYELFRCFY